MEIDIFQLPGILWRRFHYLVLSVVVCLAFSVAFILRLTPLYTSYTELLLDPQSLLAESGPSSTISIAAQQDQSSLDSQIYVVQSSTILDEVAANLDLTNDPFFVAPDKRPALSIAEARTAVVGGLKKHTTVERAGQSLVLVIGAEHPDAAKAADIANAIATVYLRQLDESRADAARRASNAFQVQASELRDRVLKAELAVEKFKADNGLASTGERGLVIDQQLAGLNEQLIAARGVEEQQQTIYEQTKSLTMVAIQSGAIPEVLQSTAIGLLRDRYIQLLDRQAQLEANLGSSHPQLRAVRSQVTNMEQAIEQELDRVRQSMKSNYERAAANTKALADRLENLTKSSFDSGAAQIKMRQLESEADAVRALYKSFLSRAEELGQQQTLKTSNSRVISAAVASPKSSALLKLIILAAGGLFGTALGAALAVLRELMSGFFKPKQEEQATSGPELLARIPIPAPQSKQSRWNPFARRRKAATPDTESAAARESAIFSVARRVRDHFAERLPATVLFVSPGPLSYGSDIVPDIVQALIDIGQDVRYAPGSLVEARAENGAGRPSLLGALGREGDQGAPLADRLKYQHLAATREMSTAGGRPTFSRYMDLAGPDAELTVINACGTEAYGLLTSLAARSDAIVVLTEGGVTAPEQLSALMQRMEPWAELVLGRIVIGDEGAANA